MHPFARAALIVLLSLAPLSALAQVSTTQSPASPAPGVVLFNDWPQDFVNQFWSAFSSDVAPYAGQLSNYVTPLPQTLWEHANDNQNNLTHFDFLYDGDGFSAGNPRGIISGTTLGRVCSLVDPTAVPTVSSYLSTWKGTASAAEANRIFIYTPNAIGGVPAGWSDWAQNHTGCPNGDYYCHYGVIRYACTTYATPGQSLLASSYSITPGQSVTLFWNDTAYRDTAWTYVSTHDYVPPSACPADPAPDTVCSASGFTLPGRTANLKSAGTWDPELSKCFYGPSTKYSVFVANPTGSVTVSPAQTTTYSYTCSNANGSRTVSATVNVSAPTPTPVPGSCGSASGRTYAYGSTSYSPYAQCSAGSPSTTAFPSAGSSQSWTCSGANGGSASLTCSASQAAPASCAATTIGNCNLSSASSGGSSGSCSSGYLGSCSYSCSNGTWSANSNICALPASCPLPWGGSITSGSSVTAYQSPSVTYPSSCASQTRTCTNGSLSGSYTNKSCAVNYPAPTAYPTVSPDPTPYGTAPAVTLHSTNANYCYVAVDWNGIAAGYFNSGTYNGPSNLSPGTHQAETYCYNVVWQGSGWSGANFTVGLQPPNPVGGGVMPTSATVGTPVSFVGTITNTGTGSTVTSFPNWLIIRSGPNGNGPDVFDKNVSAPALAAGASESVSDPAWTPSASGVYSMVVCAGYDTFWNRVPSNSSGGGCGPWTNITVANPTCTNGAINPTACTQCPNNLAYVGGSCVACNNGGCTGSGGSASSPTGGLACNNGATNPASCNAFPPSCSTLDTNPTDINAGDKVSLKWSCANASSCTQIANSDGFSTGGALSGTDSSVKPSVPSGQVTYGLSCGGTNFYFPPITVHSPKATLTASATRVPSGSTVTLHGVGTDVKSCAITNDTLGSTVIADSKAASGAWDKTSAAQTVAGQTTYTLSCKTNGASVTSSLIVNVLPGFKEF